MKLVAIMIIVMVSGMMVTPASAKKPAANSGKIPAGVLKHLSSDQYAERESAYAELQKWALKNLKHSPEMLHRAWKASEEPELKSRCFSLMKKVAIQRRFGKGKGFVGIVMQEFVVEGKGGKRARPGVRVGEVMDNTPAAKSGLKVGDVIVGIDDLDFSKEIKNNAAVGLQAAGRARLMFANYIQAKQPDDTVTLHLIRAGKEVDVKVILMKRPGYADVDRFGRSLMDDEAKTELFFKMWLREMGE